eukprot:scaffold1163_cov193-Alexandrium_tamarense.AAC.31
MPRLQAAVPKGAPPNALLRVRLPDGTEVNVRVPDGLSPGDEFQFEISGGEVTSSTTNTSKKGGGRNDKLPRQSSSRNPKKKKSHNNNSNDAPKDESNNSNNNRGSSLIAGFFQLYQKVYQTLTQENVPPSALSPVQTSTKSNKSNVNNNVTSNNKQQQVSNIRYMGFLDREIVNGKDFLTALAVGMFIGLSIVLGFLAGVLYVTPTS